MRGAENRRLEEALPHTALTAVEIANAHGASERTNDVPTILDTVSAWDSHFAILTSTSSGSLDVMTAFTRSEVEQHYTERVAAVQYAEGNELRLCEIAGRWYDMAASFVSNRLPSGVVRTFRGAYLFPTWTDGILGEIAWEVDVEDGQFGTNLADPTELTTRLNMHDDAWRSGDGEARASHYEDLTASVAGIADAEGDGRHRYVARSKDDLMRSWADPRVGVVRRLERVHHVVSAFYLFAAYRALVDVGDGAVERETATIFPLSPRGRFIGELSYSLEVRL